MIYTTSSIDEQHIFLFSRKMNYRLGLDVGTNSLGWAVLGLDENNVPSSIEDAGVRIFSDGRDEKSKATLQATRTAARSSRRRRDRFLQRKKYLLEELKKAGLFPDEPDECKRLQSLNPLELRSNAVVRQLPLHHVGRALFHLNQRRGFKSNRRDQSEDVRKGTVSNSVEKLLEEMGLLKHELPADTDHLTPEQKAKFRNQESEKKKNAMAKLAEENSLTFGTFLYQRQKAGKPIRARRNNDSKLYDVYPTRELIEDEFNKIWNHQSIYSPNVFTEEKRDLFHKIIFSQRLLKPQPIGKCSYFVDENRAYKAMPSFQRYRIYQEVNSLELDEWGKVFRLRDEPSARDTIVELLERPSVKKKPTARNASVTFKTMRKRLAQMDFVDSNSTFNFESERRKGLDGNITTNIMQSENFVGELWHSWTIEKQDEFITVILNSKLSDEEAVNRLISDYGLKQYQAENCVTAPLPDGTANISIRAAKLLTEEMRSNCALQTEAVKQISSKVASFRNPFVYRRDGELLDNLPYYGKAVQGHIIPGSGKEEREADRIGRVSNPTVHIAMNQIRLVVNELIERYGKPYSISIELGRDLPAGKEGRSEIRKEQTKNQAKNQRLNEQLAELNISETARNRLKLELWEQQNKVCIFSGQIISCADLFTPSAEIEHLIPFSMSLDDSRANKVICTQKANRDKGNQIPFDAFGHNPSGYDWDNIMANAKVLPSSKQWRFKENALDLWQKDSGDFSSRHLNDTRYIGRLAKEYLQNICLPQRIDVVTGRLTALLRGHWGLSRVLASESSAAENNRKKNRDDHRHHAIDAIVVGMITRSMLQKVSTAANRAEELNLESLFEKTHSRSSPIDPWKEFRHDVKQTISNVVASHKKRHKSNAYGSTDGQLHKETAYGVIPESEDKKGVPLVVSRRSIDKFKNESHLKQIRDPFLRGEFIAAFRKDSKNGIRQRAERDGIKSIRCCERNSVIRIANRSGVYYKAYAGNSNWGVEIYSDSSNPDGHKRWSAHVIQSFEANQANFKQGTSYRPHPTAKLVMRLRINDCVEFDDINGNRQLMRLQKISIDKRLYFAPINEANVDARNRDHLDPFSYTCITALKLKSRNARKAHVSPAGRISFAS